MNYLSTESSVEYRLELNENVAIQSALKYANKSQSKDIALQRKLISQDIKAPVRFRY